VAETKDRIHLRNTYHNVGRILENKGDVIGAASMYCKSETHGFAIPKMLFDDPITLENYIIKNKNVYENFKSLKICCLINIYF